MSLPLLRSTLCCVISASLLGCDSPTERRLAEAIARGPGTVIDLDSLAPGDWTRLYVLNPYTSGGTADSVLGFHWRGFERWELHLRDDINLLVFVDGTDVKHDIAFRRGHGDFCCFERNASYQRSRAKFVVIVDGQSATGQPWYRLRHVDVPVSNDG